MVVYNKFLDGFDRQNRRLKLFIQGKHLVGVFFWSLEG